MLQGRVEVAEYLLQVSPAGARARNMASDTVLHCALKAQANNRRLLEILIEHGTDVRAVGADRISVPPHSFPAPLHESCSCARELNVSPSLRFPSVPPAVDLPPPPRGAPPKRPSRSTGR